MADDLPRSEDILLSASSQIVDDVRFASVVRAACEDSGVVQSAVELPVHKIAWLPMLQGFPSDLVRKRRAIGSEEPGLVGASAMVDVRVGPPFAPRISCEASGHVLMDEDL